MRVAEKGSHMYGRILKVTNVTPGGPAQRAGIMVGDTIHKFSGVEIFSQSQLSQLMRQSRPGSTTLFEVDRGRHREFITVTVEGPGAGYGGGSPYGSPHSSVTRPSHISPYGSTYGDGQLSSGGHAGPYRVSMPDGLGSNSYSTIPTGLPGAVGGADGFIGGNYGAAYGPV